MLRLHCNLFRHFFCGNAEMTESEGEIEYLEEDAEIVQQCVQLSQDSPLNITKKPGPASKTIRSQFISLQNDRPSKRRWNNKTEEDDSDYDPTEENVISPPSPPPSPPRKKKTPIKKPVNIASNSQFDSLKASESRQPRHLPAFTSRQAYLNRRNMNIRIPDYDDPLCLPVRAIKSTESDLKRLNNWNKVCLEHMKQAGVMLKPERGTTKSSVRTAVFKNVVNKQKGNIETTIWSKTAVENFDGDKKSEIFQCVLPRYKEKKVLNHFILATKKMYNNRHVDHTILSKEISKDGEVLVVYKPKESLSAVYGLVDPKKREDAAGQPNDDSKMYLKELTCSKMCAPCYQTSWRGVTKSKKKTLLCPICGRIYASIYNLLSHFKTHNADDVNKNKDTISKVLSEIVGYHYKCRICRKKCASIKTLRKHVRHHQSKEEFVCEIGNHRVNG